MSERQHGSSERPADSARLQAACVPDIHTCHEINSLCASTSGNGTLSGTGVQLPEENVNKVGRNDRLDNSVSAAPSNENDNVSNASTNSVSKQSDSNSATKEGTKQPVTGDLNIKTMEGDEETAVIEGDEKAPIPFHAKLHSKRDPPAREPRFKVDNSPYEKSVSLIEPITPAAVAQRILNAHGGKVEVEVEDDLETTLAPAAAAHRILRFRSVRNKPKSFSGWRESVRSVACGLGKDHESLDLLVKGCYLWKVRRKKFQVSEEIKCERVNMS